MPINDKNYVYILQTNRSPFTYIFCSYTGTIILKKKFLQICYGLIRYLCLIEYTTFDSKIESSSSVNTHISEPHIILIIMTTKNSKVKIPNDRADDWFNNHLIHILERQLEDNNKQV